MNDEQFFCDYCGCNSNNKKLCSHCGRDISDLIHPAPFKHPVNGRMTLRLKDSKDTEHVWRELSQVWMDKVEQFSSPRHSQMEQFNTSADTVELYGADYMADMMREILGPRGTLDFQELSREQMPERLPYKPLRPPTVPRKKR